MQRKVLAGVVQSAVDSRATQRTGWIVVERMELQASGRQRLDSTETQCVARGRTAAAGTDRNVLQGLAPERMGWKESDSNG